MPCLLRERGALQAQSWSMASRLVPLETTWLGLLRQSSYGLMAFGPSLRPGESRIACDDEPGEVFVLMGDA